MGDKNRGLYPKFKVVRNDGKSAPGEKHEMCSYFVIDLNHDKYARPAIKAYADACREEYPQLSDDLYEFALSETLHEEEVCPECGGQINVKWSGIECVNCAYTFCY